MGASTVKFVYLPLRQRADSRSHWINTILVTRADLARVFNNTAMRKR
jgi:hypothetical protein